MNPAARRVDERLRGCRQNRRPCKLSRIDVRTVAGHVDAWRRRGLSRAAAIRVRNADMCGRAVWLTAKEVLAIRPGKVSIIDDEAGVAGPGLLPAQTGGRDEEQARGCGDDQAAISA